MSAPSPIADLSYRNYDGPLASVSMRWWVIAKMTMQQGVKKRGFWVWSVLSAYWYIILGAVFYFMDTISTSMPAGAGRPNLMGQIIWKDQFINGFSISQLLLFIVALLVGVGTIAGDNRANALLVYLSKPCTKWDYLLGKWVGVFLVVFAVSGIPTLIFYLYCHMSYQSYGFGQGESWFLLRILLITMLPAGFHASLCLGISSLFNQGRLAGATYAAIYFISLFFTEMMKFMYLMKDNMHMAGFPLNHLLGNLFYCSVDGIQIGLAKVILGTAGSPLLPAGGHGRSVIPEPNGLAFAGIYFGVCAISILVAYSRVRAVEVIRG